MRVISGTYRGHPLKTIKGDATRPTTDRVKESMMSAIQSRLGGFEGICVLDAFAGSGALGIEALSRGAELVWFCERSRNAISVIQGNLSALKVERVRYKVRAGDVNTLPATAGAPVFGLVFFDPPYAYDCAVVLQLADRLYESGMLTEDSIVCYEHAKKDTPVLEETLDTLQWQTVSAKDYGQTTLHLLRKELS